LNVAENHTESLWSAGLGGDRLYLDTLYERLLNSTGGVIEDCGKRPLVDASCSYLRIALHFENCNQFQFSVFSTVMKLVEDAVKRESLGQDICKLWAQKVQLPADALTRLKNPLINLDWD
jgi:hypothetical protein